MKHFVILSLSEHNFAVRFENINLVVDYENFTPAHKNDKNQKNSEVLKKSLHNKS